MTHHDQSEELPVSQSKLNISFRAVGSKAEKGRALELATGAVWAALGFRNLTYRIHATGEETDVRGTHVVSGEILKGQCKAHRVPADAPSLRLFFADVEKDRGSNRHTTGVFVSLAGFTGTAIKWHEELTADQQEYYRLITPVEFLNQMVEAGLVLSPALLIAKLRGLTTLDITGLCVVLTERGPYWMVTLADRTRTDAFFVLTTGLGAAPREEDLEYVSRRLSPPRHCRQVRLRGREDIILLLLRHGTRTLDTLTSESLQSSDDVSAILSSLSVDGLVAQRGAEVSLRLEVDAFIQMVKMLLGSPHQASPHEVTLMSSEYYSEARRSLLIPLLECRFLVKFEPSECELLLNLLSLSPRAVHRAVLGDTTSSRNLDAHLSQLSLSPEKEAIIRQRTRWELARDLALDLLVDHEEHRSAPLERLHDIKAVRIQFDLKFATRNSCHVHVGGRSLVALTSAEPGTTLQPGQLVSATGPGVFLIQGDALMAMQEFDEAIAEYDHVIQDWPASDDWAAAVNNKANCLMGKGDWSAAEQLFCEVVNHPISRKAALSNLARVFAHQVDGVKANEILATLEMEFGPDEELTALGEEVEGHLARATERKGSEQSN